MHPFIHLQDPLKPFWDHGVTGADPATVVRGRGTPWTGCCVRIGLISNKPLKKGTWKEVEVIKQQGKVN